MDVNKVRVLKRYLKRNAHPKYVKFLKEMPLHTLIILETYTGDKHILKISYFCRNQFEFKSYVLATSIELSYEGYFNNKFVDVLYIPSTLLNPGDYGLLLMPLLQLTGPCVTVTRLWLSVNNLEVSYA